MAAFKGLCFFCCLQLTFSLISGCVQTPSGPIAEKSYFAIGGHQYIVKSGDTLYGISKLFNQDVDRLADINSLQSPYTIYTGQILQLSESSSLKALSDESLNEDSFFALIQEKMKGVAVSSEKRPAFIKKVDEENQVAKTSTKVNKNNNITKSVALGRNNNEKNTGNYSNNGVKKEVKDRTFVNHKDSEWVYPVNGKVIKKFSTVGKLSKGIDFAAKAGSDVISSRPGKVVYAGSRLKGYGNLIIVKHDEAFLSAYAHNKTIFVKEGDLIKQGQKIAEVGSSGTHSPKLHFEIRKFGKPIDPLKLLKK